VAGHTLGLPPHRRRAYDYWIAARARKTCVFADFIHLGTQPVHAATAIRCVPPPAKQLSNRATWPPLPAPFPSRLGHAINAILFVSIPLRLRVGAGQRHAVAPTEKVVLGGVVPRGTFDRMGWNALYGALSK
jgi:hypothetical protein